MDRLQIKDYVYLIVMNTFHTRVTNDYIKSGDHSYRVHFRNLSEDDLQGVIKEMVDQGHLVLSDDGEYIPTDAGRAIFSSGGYITNYLRSK